MACCFFGHHDVPALIKDQLANEIEQLIKNGENIFYVGNHGDFDYMVINILRNMKKNYPHICYSVVLAYLEKTEHQFLNSGETLFPEGIEDVPKKFAILWRNDWMIKNSDTVLCYVTHNFGGAAKAKEKAIKQKKTIINLEERL